MLNTDNDRQIFNSTLRCTIHDTRWHCNERTFDARITRRILYFKNGRAKSQEPIEQILAIFRERGRWKKSYKAMLTLYGRCALVFGLWCVEHRVFYMHFLSFIVTSFFAHRCFCSFYFCILLFIHLVMLFCVFCVCVVVFFPLVSLFCYDWYYF